MVLITTTDCRTKLGHALNSPSGEAVVTKRAKITNYGRVTAGVLVEETSTGDAKGVVKGGVPTAHIAC